MKFSKKILLICLYFIFLFLVYSSKVYPQQQRGVIISQRIDKPRNVYAIVVGISDYTSLQDLQFAHKDAALFADYLKNDCGVPENNIKLFLNEEATRLNVVDDLYNLNDKVKSDDLIFMYFAGHGDVESKISEGDALLLLHKSLKVNYLRGFDFIRMTELRDWLDNLVQKKAQVVFISDACHSGGLAGGKEGQEKTLASLKADWRNQTKLLSCQMQEISLESKEWGGGRGLFSFHLIEGLQGLADTDNNGFVSLIELQIYLQKNVREQALPNHQTPLVIGNLDQELSKVKPEKIKYLIEQKKKDYPTLAKVNSKNGTDITSFGADSMSTINYILFTKALKEKRLLKPTSNCALFYLDKIQGTNEAVRLMRRNLAAALQDKAMTIITPLLKGQKRNFTVQLYKEAAHELRQAIVILGQGHYLNKNLEARALFLEAYLEATENHGQSAIQLLNQSIALEPNTSYSYLLSGILHQKLVKYDTAISNYQRYLLDFPNDGSVCYNLGAIYRTKQNYKDAVVYFQKAVDTEPTNPTFLGALGDTQKNLKMYHEAGINRQKAILFEDKNTEY